RHAPAAGGAAYPRRQRGQAVRLIAAASDTPAAARRSQPHQTSAQPIPEAAIVPASGYGVGVSTRLSAAATSAPIRNCTTPNSDDAVPPIVGNRPRVRAIVFANTKPTPSM